MLGLMHQSLLTFGDGALHGVKGLGEIAELVVTLDWHDGVVVPRGDPLRGAGQRAYRQADTPGQQGCGDGGQYQPAERQPQQLTAKDVIGFQHLLHRQLQDRADLLG